MSIHYFRQVNQSRNEKGLVLGQSCHFRPPQAHSGTEFVDFRKTPLNSWPILAQLCHFQPSQADSGVVCHFVPLLKNSPDPRHKPSLGYLPTSGSERFRLGKP